MFIMRKVKYGLLAGMVAATILAVTACGNNQEDSGTTTPTSNETSTTQRESTTNNRETDNTGTNNDGVLNEIGNDIKDGVEDIGTDLGIDGTGTDGTGTGNGTGTGTTR